MSYKHTLLAGTSVLALVLGSAATADAQSFVFGNSSATVTATIGATAIGTSDLLSQVNNDSSVSSSLDSNQLITGTGTTTAGGSSAISSNVMSATAIANQLSNNSGNTYVIDPSYTPAGGFATLGTSQLNYNSAPIINTARLGAAGTTGNAIAFTADDAYGAPVALNSNSFAARVNGNLALSNLSGAVPTGGFSTGAASIVASGTSGTSLALAPVGTLIEVTAPVSLSNVQQNITDGGTATLLEGTTANTVVSALFAGATGFNGGSVTVSANAVTAAAAGNSATVGLDLSSAINPTLGGGVSVFSAQGNNAAASGGTASTLTVAATNTNTTLRVMGQEASTGTLTQLSGSTATLAGNTVSSRAALNDITSQTLNTSATLAAGGSAGGTLASQLFSPSSTATIGAVTTATIGVTADYLNIASQNNVGDTAGSVIGTATVTSPIIGFFGGVANGAVTVQGNAISGTVQGNVAAISTVMPLVSGAASSVTGLMQSNTNALLTATVEGAQIRISDSSALLFGTTDQNMTVSSVPTASEAAISTAGSGATLTSAMLNIGSADTAALGNTVRATTFGNSGSATANLGQTTASGNIQVTTFGSTGSSASTPTGTLIESTAPTSVIVAQQNLNVAATAQVTHSAAGAATGLFQIDAYLGLTDGAATIGNNALRSTAVGNFGEASATIAGATSNTLAGGVAVGTFQGNATSSVNAFLGGNEPIVASGPVASIGIDALSNSTAQVVNNTFAAVAVGNSATGMLAIPAGTILGGVAPSAAQYTNTGVVADGTGALTGSYVVGNAQVNASTTVVASNLNANTFNPAMSASTSSTTGFIFDTSAPVPTSSTGATSRMNVGATSFTDANGLVTGNTVSTTAVANEYGATVSGLVTAAGASSTTLSLGSTQRNTTNSTVTSANIGNGFTVATTVSGANGTSGITDNTGSNATNSVLSVVGNTASAAATGNTSRLGVTGIATSGSNAATFGATLSAAGDGNQTSTAPVAITNQQTNAYSNTTVPIAIPDILASSLLQNFGVNVGSSPTTTGSTLQVNTNAMTATATANTADLSATLATGPTYQGGVGLNNMQSNLGADRSLSTSTVNTSVRADAAFGFFNVGTGIATLSGATATPGNATVAYDASNRVSNSTVSVAGNRMVATATQNAATLSVTAAASTLVQGAASGATLGGVAGSSPTATTVDAAAGTAAINVQAIEKMDSLAFATNGVFSATANATNSTVAVNSNVVGSIARGNTAETRLNVPRIDGTMQAFNAQSASASNFEARTGDVFMAALNNAATPIATSNTSVSVSSNLISAASTVNNYSATMSGLGQSGAVTSSPLAAATALVTAAGVGSVSFTTGTLALASAQQITGVTSTADALNVRLGIDLSTLTTTSSPLSLNSNTVSASANGNVAAQNILADGAGAGAIQTGMGNYVAQGIGGATTLSGTVSGVSIQAGTGTPTLSGVPSLATASYLSSSPVSNSTVSVSDNRMVATATANAATLSVTAAASTLVQGSAPTNTTITSAGGSTNAASAGGGASIAASNAQSIATTDTNAFATAGVFSATANATNSTVAVNSNVISSTARGNTAETTLGVPRIDGTMQAFNAQSASGSNIAAQTSGVFLTALTQGTDATTTNTSVSVSSNLVLAASTVNNYAATMSGLGQSGGATVSQAIGTVAVTAAGVGSVSRTDGTLTLGSAQQITGGTSTAGALNVNLGISLANLTTASSPLSVNSNTVAATVNGNVSAQSILANGAGAGDSQGGMGNYSAQGFGVAASDSAVLATVNGVGIRVDAAVGSSATPPSADTTTGSPISVSSNSVSASATANTATLSTAFNGMIRSAGSGSVSTASDASGTGAVTTSSSVTADYALVSVQSMSGSGSGVGSTTRAVADVSNVTIAAVQTERSTSDSPLNISSNSVTATANGNVSALSMIGNVSGVTARGGSAVNSSQVMESSTVSASTATTLIGGQMVGTTSPPAGYMLTNSPVTISGNMVGASATGNSASLNSGFASSVRQNGTSAASATSTAAAGLSTANGDYVLLNTQRASGSMVSASTMGATISYAGAATNGPVNVQGNTVFATAFGNSATMALSGAQAGGSIQSTNYQQTNGTTVSALISGTTIGANMANAASSNAPVNVNGNVLRAVAVGNSATNAIGR